MELINDKNKEKVQAVMEAMMKMIKLDVAALERAYDDCIAAPGRCDLSSSTPPETRAEDLPLHEDVRWLAAALGQVILRLEGEAAFETVESLRQATRSRRHGEPGAPSLATLLDTVDTLSLDRAATTARAFTLFFLLINTAEQVHRVRRTREYRRRD